MLYAGFILFGLYLVILQKNYSDAAIYFGIALAFDPFDTSQSWGERPRWQKGWLIVHLAIVAALFGMQLGLGDR